MKALKIERGHLLTSFALLVGLILLHQIFPARTFWAGDEGNKFIQLESFNRFGFQGIEIPYAGSGIDPAGKYFPHGGNHFIRIENAFYSYYHFYFSLVSLPFYKLFGFAGIYFLPLLFTLFCFSLTASLVRSIEAGEFTSGAILVFCLCTPFLFYSITFWEHTLAVALTTAAVVLVVRPTSPGPTRFLIAGMLIGLSTIFREEGYVFVVAIALTTLLIFPRKYSLLLHLIAGWMIFVLPLMIFQKQMYGHPLGAHAVMNPSPLLDFFKTLKVKFLLDALSNYFIFLFEYHPDPVMKVILVSPHILLVLAGLFFPRKKLLIFLLSAACVTTVVLFVELARNPQPVWNTLYTQGLIPAIPFVLVLFALSKNLLFSPNTKVRFLTILLFVYLIGSCLNLNQTVFGIIWGPRHFLPIMPLVVALTIHGIREVRTNADWSPYKKVFSGAAILLVISSIAIQAFGLVTMHLKRAASAELDAAIRKSPAQVIITDAYWVPEALATIFFEKQIHMVKSESELRHLLSLLKKAGYKDFLFLRSREYRKLPDSSMMLLLQMAVRRDLLVFPRIAFLDSAILHCDLQRMPAARE